MRKVKEMSGEEKIRLSKCCSGAVHGVNAQTVEIEVCQSSGSPQFAIVGLPDAAVKEAKDRVSTAVCNSGFKKIESFITVNLAPANVRKEGPVYDLPIAVALLAASGKIRNVDLSGWALIGELALSGAVRSVRGILPVVIEMRRIGMRGIIVPVGNADEASVVEGIDVIPVSSLRETTEFLEGNLHIEPVRCDLDARVETGNLLYEDFADVKGQDSAKRAMEVAVAGGHNILMIGSPGAGKTMLARRIPSILPPLSVDEALEVARIHSVAGVLKVNSALALQRPFRAPHHTVSYAGLLGGGAHPVPGEVSLAHRGVLFLDELPEFRRDVLEVLRQPLEDGCVTVSRAQAACDFPSRIMLVAAMNPCPCGYADDPHHECRCSHNKVMNYRGKISGPLLDRIDIQIGLPPVSYHELAELPPGETSAEIRKRVVAAGKIQRMRFAETPGVYCNAEIRPRDISKFCKLDPPAERRMRSLLMSLDLSARAYDRVLKVARTVADLCGSENVREEHVFEASQYRELDKAYWK